MVDVVSHLDCKSKMMNSRILAAFGAALVVALPAHADLAGATVEGTLAFGPYGLNGGQFWSAPTQVVGSGVEFAFSDIANVDTADFTGSQLIIEDHVQPLWSANGWQMTFATGGSGFTSVSLVSSSFDPGITYGLLAGGVIVVDWIGVGGNGPHDFRAVFDVTTAVPEPGTYALMALGLTAMGFLARRRTAG